MSRLGKTLVWVFAMLVLVPAGGITLTIGWLPFLGPRARPLTDRKVQSTPERLAGASTWSKMWRTAWGATQSTTGRRTMRRSFPVHSAPARTLTR